MAENVNHAAPATQYLTGLKLCIILASLTLANFLVLLDSSIIGTATPRITTEFHSLPDFGWYIGAYTLGIATLQPLSGKIYTHFSNKAVFLIFLFVFELGSLICGASKSSVLLIAGRAVAGLGASGIFNGAMTVMRGAVPKKKSPLYMGILFGTSQIGVVLGPLIGGALTEHVSWRWCFWINLPIGGAAAIVMSLIRIPEAKTKPPFTWAYVTKIIPDLDLFGFALFVPWSVMLLLALQLGSSEAYSWSSPTIIGLFCGTGVCFILFVAWEWHMGEQAMVPGTLLRRRVVWTSYLYAPCIGTCMMTASNWLPTYFQAVKGNGPTASGVYVLPSITSQIVMVVVVGAAVWRTKYHLPFAFTGGVITAIGNGLVSTFTASTSRATWIGYQIVMGTGRGFCMQMAFIVVQNAVSSDEYPVAIACLIFFQSLGSSITSVIANTIFAQTLTLAIPRYAPSISPRAARHAGSGASAVRALVPAGHENELSGLLRAYSESLRNVFYFLVGVACLATVVSFGMGLKKDKDEEKATEVSDEESGGEKVARSVNGEEESENEKVVHSMDGEEKTDNES